MSHTVLSSGTVLAAESRPPPPEPGGPTPPLGLAAVAARRSGAASQEERPLREKPGGHTAGPAACPAPTPTFSSRPRWWATSAHPQISWGVPAVPNLAESTCSRPNPEQRFVKILSWTFYVPPFSHPESPRLTLSPPVWEHAPQAFIWAHALKRVLNLNTGTEVCS